MFKTCNPEGIARTKRQCNKLRTPRVRTESELLHRRFLFFFCILFKKWFMLGMRLRSYGCTREIGRAREKRLSGTRRSRVLL